MGLTIGRKPAIAYLYLMETNSGHIWHTTTLHPKNMVSQCCLTLIKRLVEENEGIVERIKPGELVIRFNPARHNREFYIDLLAANGFEPVMSHDRLLVEKIRLAVIELVHKAGHVNSLIRNSDYLVERLGMSYAYLSALFSKYEHITLEKYIILHKIEKVKELLEYDEITLSEIAVRLGYSSVQYLSSQFRQVTGIAVSEYRKGGYSRTPLELIGKTEPVADGNKGNKGQAD